jgi:hypothetical protein
MDILECSNPLRPTLMENRHGASAVDMSDAEQHAST